MDSFLETPNKEVSWQKSCWWLYQFSWLCYCNELDCVLIKGFFYKYLFL